MLPAHVEALIKESIDVYLKSRGFRPPTFAQRLLARSFGGQVIQPAKVAAVTAEEIETVSAGLVTSIQKVIENVGIAPSEDLQNDLLRLFDSEFDTCAAAIKKFGGTHLTRIAGTTSESNWFDRRLNDAKQARHLELKLLTAKRLKTDETDSKSVPALHPAISPSVKIFISHSSADRELAALLVDLLRSSLNLPAETIRCTSVEGHRLAGGAETDSALRKDIRECEAFIGLISATSIESAYVLFELGARWGAERHLLPLLAPTANAEILRGPLSGVNALRSSSAADLHQMVDEVAAVLKISSDKPAAYQRHIEQILGWGAVRTAQSVADNPKSDVKAVRQGNGNDDDFKNGQAIIEKHCEEQWPDNYSMRAFCIQQEERALNKLKDGRPSDIPDDIFRRIRRRCAEQWPTNFGMRLFTEQEEVKSYRKLQERSK